MKPKLVEFERLVCDYLDDALSEEERERFETMLCRDSAALDLLCSHSLLISSLNSLPEPDCGASRKPAKPPWRHRRRRTLGGVLTATAVVMLVAGGVVHRIMVTRSIGAGLELAPHTVFTISGMEPQDRFERLNLGETLSLSQGSARLTLADGTVCLAEAPARISLRARNHIETSRGIVSFRTGPDSESLTVSTRHVEAINLGASFGIDDRMEGQSQLHVFEGKVRATTLTRPLETSVLGTGHATIAGGKQGLRPIPADSLRFPTSLPRGLPAVRFSFDADPQIGFSATGSLATSCGIRFVESLDSPRPRTVSVGRYGQAIRFTAQKQSIKTTWPGIEGTLPRTVSFWIRIDDATREMGGHILGWGLPSGGTRMSQFSLVYSGSQRAAIRVASGRRWLQGATRLDDGQWHHIAVVLGRYTPGDWPHVKVYVDGKPEPLVSRTPEEGSTAPLDSFNTITQHQQSIPLTFGSFNPTFAPGAFPGSLDEVILAAGIVTESQINALYEGRLEASGLSLPELEGVHISK